MKKIVKELINSKLEQMFQNHQWKNLMEAYKSESIEIAPNPKQPVKCFLCDTDFTFGYYVTLREKGTKWTGKSHIIICLNH